MQRYRPDISFGRIISNLSPDHIDRLDDTYMSAGNGLSQKMKHRTVLLDQKPPMIRLVHEDEMSAVQQNIGRAFSDQDEEELWTAVRRDLPTEYFQHRTVQTWPGEVVVRHFPEKEVWIGADPGLLPERDFILSALQTNIPKIFGSRLGDVMASWDPTFRPGYHLATVEPTSSDRIINALVEAAQQPDILPAQLATDGVQLVTTLRQL